MFDYNSLPVSELVPHSAPMILIDRIIDYGHESLVAEVDILASSMFYDDEIEGVPSWVGIEYMAQTISALAGVQAKVNNEPIKLGFLLGARKYHMPHKVFTLGDVFKVSVKQLFRDDLGLASFECKILKAEEVWATSSVNVYEANEMNKAVKE